MVPGPLGDANGISFRSMLRNEMPYHVAVLFLVFEKTETPHAVVRIKNAMGTIRRGVRSPALSIFLCQDFFFFLFLFLSIY